jgi:dTDP-4-dehydrorhamnose reductase
LFGARGQLGQALLRVGKARGVGILGFDRSSGDITDRQAVRKAISAACADVIVNAAAYTAVDKAESEPDLAHAINCEGASILAQAAEQAGIPIIHMSTDYVFAGSKHEPYLEDDQTGPLCVYGRSKVQGEAAVRSATSRAIILRTAWVFGLEGANFVKTMLRLAVERDVLRVVNDQHGCPTFADDLAEGIVSIAGQCANEAWGTYHLTGSGRTSWFDFAQEIFAQSIARGIAAPRVEPISTAQYPTAARRPANSVLDCAKVKGTFAVELPAWNDGLSRMLSQHFARIGVRS